MKEQRFLVTVDLPSGLAAGIYVYATTKESAIAQVKQHLAGATYKAYSR